MSEVTNVTNDSNFVHNDYDTSKIFYRNIKTLEAVLNNDTGSDLTLEPGTPVGRKSSNGKLKALASAANDGSQYCVGILMSSVTALTNGSDADVTIVISGEVSEAKIEAQLAGADTLDTAVTNNGGKFIRDVIAGDTAGIVLREVTDLTDYDNQ